MRGCRICHRKTCHFGILSIFSSRYLKNSKYFWLKLFPSQYSRLLVSKCLLHGPLPSGVEYRSLHHWRWAWPYELLCLKERGYNVSVPVISLELRYFSSPLGRFQYLLWKDSPCPFSLGPRLRHVESCQVSMLQTNNRTVAWSTFAPADLQKS